MVIFVLAMVITILMTIVSEKMAVFGWSENCHFRHRCPLGRRTGKLWKPLKPLPDAETPEMYIYTLLEKYLRCEAAAIKVQAPRPAVCGPAGVGATGVAAGATRPLPHLSRCLTATSAGPARAAAPA